MAGDHMITADKLAAELAADILEAAIEQYGPGIGPVVAERVIARSRYLTDRSTQHVTGGLKALTSEREGNNEDAETDSHRGGRGRDCA